MTAPLDPFATPGDGNTPPAYSAPPAYSSPPTYSTQPGYGAPATAWTGPPLASWGLRVGGYLIDALIIIVASSVANQISDSLGTLVNFALFVGFGYLTGVKGQTPGRQLVKISVVKEVDGTFLGAGAGIGRAFLHILDVLPLCLGYLWPIWDPKNQTFADKVIKSVVVKVA